MSPLIGLAVGVISGGFQFWLLTKLTKHITSGEMAPKYMLMGVLQFFLPLGVLVGIAFLRRQDLLLTAIGITGALVIGAVTKNIILIRNKRKGGDNNE